MTNKKAPNFKLPSTSNEIIELNMLKSKFIVLYFYPKDDTPGCTLETKDFNLLLSKFKKNNCSIFGISKDDLKSHFKFKNKYRVKFDLLADEKKEAIKAYKVWGKKKFLGREFMGLIRSTFLIKDKKIIKEWRSVKVKDHAKEVLNFIEEL
ncbi:MAG: peroxiredoxin [Candidatus Pelagibacter sp.]|jgi:peroxiredoxin Q/BCP|nr:peroxiredoxin [Candidatus Pelagibacter sp.]MDP7540939.1 peroxiredoxin [Candidatus Pelagibacter bacterium]|tara:strand:+ start:823 stop:1275 length:453 start_codon:yes stop_codon:yes gene_type:complete